MRLALQINEYNWPVETAQLGAALTEIGEAADAYGFSAIAVADHPWQASYMGGPERRQMECYTTLAFLAAATQQARLLAMVSGVHFRAPALLAKTVTTLDVLSGGRAGLGIGTGWQEAEAVGLGFPFPSVSERFEWLEETLQICLQLWRGDETPFEGHHYHLDRPLIVPRSLTQPHPPVLIAGDGEQKTLRLVARYGDACSLKPTPAIPHKLDVLRRHCAEVGRDYDEIEKTSVNFFDPGPDGSRTGELLAMLRGYADMGIQTMFGNVPDLTDLRRLEIIGRDVIPEIAAW